MKENFTIIHKVLFWAYQFTLFSFVKLEIEFGEAEARNPRGGGRGIHSCKTELGSWKYTANTLVIDTPIIDGKLWHKWSVVNLPTSKSGKFKSFLVASTCNENQVEVRCWTFLKKKYTKQKSSDITVLQIHLKAAILSTCVSASCDGQRKHPSSLKAEAIGGQGSSSLSQHGKKRGEVDILARRLVYWPRLDWRWHIRDLIGLWEG